MKKSISVLLAILMVLTMLPLGGLSMFAATSGDFKYSVSSTADKTCTITGYTGSATKLTIPSELDGYTVTSIGYNAFRDYTALISVIIPGSVTEIEYGAFWGCSSLGNITLPNVPIHLGANVFLDTKYYNNESNWSDSVLYIGNHLIQVKYDAGLSRVIVRDGTLSIAAWAVYDNIQTCKGLQIPESVEAIGNYFDGWGEGHYLCCAAELQHNPSYGCPTLYGYTGSYAHVYAAENGLPFNSIGVMQEKFEYELQQDGTAKITNYRGGVSALTIPSSLDGYTVTKIQGFESNKCIQSVIIPNTVTSIEERAFTGCTALTSVTIPNSVMSIGDAAFARCTALTSISIPKNVTNIGGWTFSNCDKLTSIIIPDSVTNIGERAFEGCHSLASITIPDSIKHIGNAAFFDTAYYDNESNWANNVLYIGNHLIEADNTVSGEYTIRTGTKSIAAQAFEGCYSLTSVKIPDGLTNVEIFAFVDCISLTSITIPNSVVSISAYVFEGCTNLTIYGYHNSTAESYAKSNGIPFVALDAVELSSISIATQPSKKTYYIGDSLDTSGLQLKLTYSDSSTKTVSSGYTTSGFSSATAGTKTVTVTYEGLTATFNVMVNTPSISISPSNKTMTVGDTATLTATTTPSGQSITWTSSNTSVATVSNGVVIAKASGTATITAKFTYNGKTYSNTCRVTVNNPIATVSSIAIQSKPTKTVYTVGEAFSTSGLSIKVNMSDGTSKTVTSGFTVSSPDMSTAGTKTVTVTYEGKTASFNITVNKPVSPTAAKYQISGAKAVAGSTVEIYVSIENNPGIISLRNKIAYDTSVLELVKVEDLKLLSGYTTPSPIVDSPYILRWADSLATENNHANGNFVKLTFKIKDDAQAGNYGISVSHIESRTATGEKVEFADCGAVITVIDYIPGDVDGNGVVDDWDAIVLNRYLAGWKTEVNKFASDIDGNGEIDDWDAIALERKLAGWNS